MRVQADKAEVMEALSKENRSDSMAGTNQEEFKVDQKSDHTQEPEKPEAEEKQEQPLQQLEQPVIPSLPVLTMKAELESIQSVQASNEEHSTMTPA